MYSVLTDSIYDWGMTMAGWFALLGVVFGGAAPGEAQVAPGSAANALTSEERPIRITIRPAYQRYEDEGRILTQWSAPLRIVIPFRDRWQASIRGGGASAGGNNVRSLSGLTDVRGAVSYAQSVGNGSVVLNANVNVPTGKEELDQGEFITATLLSQNFYQFRVPSFGRGFGGGGGATWAIPVTESVVIGLGGAFQYQGSYDPLVGRQQKYDPGEEGRFTAGADVQLTRVSALSADVSLFVYGTDTIDGVDQFEPGKRGSVRLQYLRRGREQTLRILGKYRQQEKSALPVRGGLDRELQVLPSYGMVQGQYSAPLSDMVQMRASAGAWWYAETATFESKILGTVGAGLGIEIGEGVEVSPRVKYTMGSIMGLTGSLNIATEL